MAPEPRDDSHAGSSPRDIEGRPVFAVSSTSAVQGLTDAVVAGERFIALTGEPGVSRSAIVDALVIDLIDAGIRVVRVRNRAPGSLGVGRLVVLLLGGQHTRGDDDDLQRVLLLLTDQGHCGKRLVVAIEDADKLEHAALELLKLLPELHREGSPRAQILLVGRPGLWTLLAHRWHAPLSEIAPPVATTTAIEGRVQDVDGHQVVSAEEWPAPPQGTIRLLGATGASWFLSQVAGRPAAHVLLMAAFAITGVTLVAHHGSPLRPGSSLQEATSRPAAGELPASTPLIATTSASGSVADAASRMAITLSGKNQVLAATSGQQFARSGFPPAVARAAPTQQSVRVPSQRRAEGAGLDAGTMSQARHELPQAVLSLDLVEHEGNGRTLDDEPSAAQPQNQNETDVDFLSGGGISPPDSGTRSPLILFRGQLRNAAMHGKGKLSVAIWPHGSGAITARYDAGAGSLGRGEFAGNLSEDGHLSAHGRVMVGDNVFFCYLSGSIVGHRLVGSARFVRSSGGRVTGSSFTLIRS